MAMKLIMNDRKSYCWYNDGDIYFRGYFIVNANYYSGMDAIEFLKGISDFGIDELAEVMKDFNGIFSILLNRKSDVILVADRLRGLPLFYSIEGDITISENAKSVIDCCNLMALNQSAVCEYSASGLFVSGYDTMIQNLYQVQAAEIVKINKKDKKILRNEYFHYSHKGDMYSEEELIADFDKNYDAIADNLVLALQGRTAVIPLSGGADSRMVVSMLHKKEYKKVICFTYGLKDNLEARISKEVADYYGYPWYMVEYSPKMWSNFQKSNTLFKFDEYATNYVSTTHIQDFLAISHLISNGIIPEDAVFIPGHSGDMIAGSHLTEAYLKEGLDYDSFIKLILEKFYANSESGELCNKLRERFGKLELNTTEDYSREMEWFNTKERQAKFIVNSCRAYEYFEHEWLIPLWDNAQFEFWSKVPIELRYDRKLYFKCVKDGIKSTNDKSTISEVGDWVRKVPGLNTVARRIRRISSYYTSKLGFEKMFSFNEYMRACFCMHPTFTINDLLCKKHLNRLYKEFELTEE